MDDDTAYAQSLTAAWVNQAKQERITEALAAAICRWDTGWDFSEHPESEMYFAFVRDSLMPLITHIVTD